MSLCHDVIETLQSFVKRGKLGRRWPLYSKVKLEVTFIARSLALSDYDRPSGLLLIVSTDALPGLKILFEIF